MTLEQVIHNAVADALSKQLQPLIEPLIGKLKINIPNSAEDFLTTAEASKFLKVSPITMSIWRCKKRGPDYVVIGDRGVRYKRSALLAFIERNGSLIGKQGRPPKTTVVKTSGVPTGSIKTANQKGVLAQAGK